jgi:hypothetical protein
MLDLAATYQRARTDGAAACPKRASSYHKHRKVSRGSGVPQYPHDRGYAGSREEAMTDFKVRWEL